jgi:tetratricopeptide (TPR) repeat protein
MIHARILALAAVILVGHAVMCGHALTGRECIIEARHCLTQGDNTARETDYLGAKTLLAACVAQGEYQPLAEYYLGYADYRLGVVVHRMDKAKAIVYLDSAVEHLQKAIALESTFAEAHALLASCYGIKISFAPFKGIILGPRSSSAMQTAMGLAPRNPRVALLGAIGTYNTPSVFGGGKDKGLDALNKAAELFDQWQEADSLRPDWGAAEVYAWIGMAHLQRNEMILARNAFEKALQITPDYGWVKNDLLPKVTSHSGRQ